MATVDNDNNVNVNSATGNEVNDDGDGATGDDNNNDDDGDHDDNDGGDSNGDTEMGDGATGCDGIRRRQRWRRATTAMATVDNNNDVNVDSATGNEVNNDGDGATRQRQRR